MHVETRLTMKNMISVRLSRLTPKVMGTDPR